jgi:hypothetical protein
VIVNVNPSNVGAATEKVGTSPAPMGTVVVVVDVVEVVVGTAGFTPILDAYPNDPAEPGDTKVISAVFAEKSSIDPPFSCRAETFE